MAVGRARSTCSKHGSESVPLILRFSPNGSSTASVAEIDQQGTPRALCVVGIMSGVPVPPFSGPSQEIGVTVPGS